MELSEKHSYFDLNLLLSFQLTFPEGERTDAFTTGGSYQQLTTVAFPPNQRHQKGEYLRERRLVKNSALGTSVGVCPTQRIKAKLVLQTLLSGKLGLQSGNPK